MPTLILLASTEDANRLKGFGALIGHPLRQAVATVIPLENGADGVSFIVLPYVVADNSAPLVLLGIASSNDERLPLLEDWRNELARTWKLLREEKKLELIADVLSQNVEVWPLMPPGSWLLVAGDKT